MPPFQTDKELLEFAKHCQHDTFNLKNRMILSLNCLSRLLDPRLDYLPYFNVFMTDPPEACHDWPDYGDMTGRYLEAHLMIEEMTGVKTIEQEKLKALLLSFFSGNDGLSYRHPKPWHEKSALMFDQSRVLFALNRWYGKTRDKKLLSVINKFLKGLLSVATKKGNYYSWGGCGFLPPGSPNRTMSKIGPAYDTGIMIEPLLDCYEITGNPLALELAAGAIDYIIFDSGEFGPNGEYTWHLHSHSATAIGAVRYGLLFHKQPYIDWGQRVYEFTKKQGTDFGWMREAVARKDDLIGCETCCIMDMIELGILLAQAGYRDYYDDVERFGKNHLLESQILDADWLSDTKRKEGTERYTCDNVKNRMLGSFAGWSAPNDILAYEECYLHDRFEIGTPGFFDGKVRLLQSCCNASGPKGIYFLWRHAVHKIGENVYVHLLFTNDYEKVRVKNHIPREGRIEISVINAPTLLVRIPRFADNRSLKVTRDNKPVDTKFKNDYLMLTGNLPGSNIALTFDLTEREDSVTICNEGFKQFTYNYKWVGDTVVKMEPKGKYFHLYNRSHLLD